MKIFISYRRDDSGYITDRIYDYLVPRIGRSAVFRDINSIDPGSNFAQRICDSIASCDTLLAVIGDRWMQVDGAGRSRLHSENDFVRLEIQSALKLKIPVIPLLVESCQMPSAADLPPGIIPIAHHNAIPIRRDPDFSNDMSRLLKFLKVSDTRTENTRHKPQLDFGNLGI